jgi:predicted transcriptional regulator
VDENCEEKIHPKSLDEELFGKKKDSHLKLDSFLDAEAEQTASPIGQSFDVDEFAQIDTKEDVAIPNSSPTERLSSALGRVVVLYQQVGLVGEERNILQIFLIALSRHLPDKHRRHAAPHGESGSGKTTVVRRVLRPFWKDVVCYSRITGPGMDRSDESLDGKILFLEQLSGWEPSQLKFLLSEGELGIRYSERDNSGHFVSVEHRVRGMPVFITTMVGAQIDSQLLNRLTTLEIDESSEQTKRIIDHKLKDWSSVKMAGENMLGEVESIDEKCRELGRRIVDIKIPYAPQLSNGFPLTVSMRRRIDQLLSLVDEIAFYKAALGLRPLAKIRETSEVRNTYVIALPEDLQDALICIGDTESFNYGFQRAQEIHRYLCSHDWSTAKDVGKALGLSQNRAREYLNQLVDSGYATKTKEKNTFYYEPVPRDRPRLELNATFTESDLKAWFSENFPDGVAELLVPEEPETVVAVHPRGAISDTVEEIMPKSCTKSEIEPVSEAKGDTNHTRSEMSKKHLETEEVEQAGADDDGHSSQSDTKDSKTSAFGAETVGKNIQLEPVGTVSTVKTTKPPIDLRREDLIQILRSRGSWSSCDEAVNYLVELGFDRDASSRCINYLIRDGLFALEPDGCWRLTK